MVCSVTDYACYDVDATPIVTQDMGDCSPVIVFPHDWNCTEASPSALIATVSSELSTQSAQLANDAVNIISIGFAMVIIALGAITALKYLGGKKL